MKHSDDIVDQLMVAYEFDRCDVCKDAAGEIERLRDQLAAMERGYKSFRDTAETEYARLRGLLQWWLDAGPDADWDEHERCVREALEKK